MSFSNTFVICLLKTRVSYKFLSNFDFMQYYGFPMGRFQRFDVLFFLPGRWKGRTIDKRGQRGQRLNHSKQQYTLNQAMLCI